MGCELRKYRVQLNKLKKPVCLRNIDFFSAKRERTLVILIRPIRRPMWLTCKGCGVWVGCHGPGTIVRPCMDSLRSLNMAKLLRVMNIFQYISQCLCATQYYVTCSP